MANAIYHDRRRRALYGTHEVRRRVLKSLLVNDRIPFSMKQDLEQKLQRLPRNSGRTRIQNRCIQTGRPKAVYRKFRCSRLVLRELAGLGLLPGVYKSSW